MWKLSAIFLLLAIGSVLSTEETLLHFVSDDVPSGSYKYYSLTYDGLIKIQLTSVAGDADLYVSQTTAKPTYEPDHYCLQSTTCGEDVIIIPKSFKRPVSIGVYGHPSHDLSRYSLLVYQLPVADDEYSENYQNPEPSLQRDREAKTEKPSFAVALLWSLIDILFQVFVL